MGLKRLPPDQQVETVLFMKLPPPDELQVPDPTAHLYAGVHKVHSNGDAYSTATPTIAEARPYLTGQPLFFRSLTPPILTEYPVPGALARHADSPELRALCVAETEALIRRFSPEMSIKDAPRMKPEKMPVVDAALARYRKDHFADCDMIAVQHLYSQTVGMLDAMRKKGLDYRTTTVIGKSYSTNYAAARALVDRGARVPLEPLEQHALESHVEVMQRSIRSELERYREKVKNGTAKKKLLVLDEGGQVVELLHREFPDLLERTVAVEQTTRGILRVSALDKIRCVLVNVARSRLKTTIESRLIGLSLFYEISRKLIHLQLVDTGKEDTISILGAGVVGREVARVFALSGYKVRIYDQDPIIPELLPDGVEIVSDRTAFLKKANVLVSVTGAKPLTVADYALLPNRAKLFNGASADDELASADAIRAARLDQPPRSWWDPEWKKDKTAYIRGLPDLLADREYVHAETGWLWGEYAGNVIPLGHIARRAQRDRVLHFGDKEIYLAKGGFVANLTDAEDPVPPRYIQVTRACLAAACAEALDHLGDPKIHPLGDPVQNLIEKRYKKELAEDFDDPKWIPKWVKKPPSLIVIQGTPKVPPDLAPMFDGLAMSSPSHVLLGGASH